MIKKQIVNWLAVIAWIAVIYYFSHQPDLKSELEPFWDLIFRKIAHMAEYFVLSFLLFRAWSGHNLSFKKSLILSVVFAVLYAGFDEWHQTSISGRQGSIKDVGIDSIGVLSFVILSFIYKKKNKTYL